jgi:hypothetical protein
MTKKEAEKLLYVFLKRHKLAEKYYYYCVVYNERRSHGRENYLSLPRKVQTIDQSPSPLRVQKNHSDTSLLTICKNSVLDFLIPILQK